MMHRSQSRPGATRGAGVLALALLAGVAVTLVPPASAAKKAKPQRDAAASIRAGTRTGLESLESHVQEFTLANGLHFIVVPRHNAPVFSFATVVDAGAANDQVGTTGLAHMMEHMAFKGTELVGTKDYAAEAPLLTAEEAAWNKYYAERSKGARADTAASSPSTGGISARRCGSGNSGFFSDTTWKARSSASSSRSVSLTVSPERVLNGLLSSPRIEPNHTWTSFTFASGCHRRKIAKSCWKCSC